MTDDLKFSRLTEHSGEYEAVTPDGAHYHLSPGRSTAGSRRADLYRVYFRVAGDDIGHVLASTAHRQLAPHQVRGLTLVGNGVRTLLEAKVFANRHNRDRQEGLRRAL